MRRFKREIIQWEKAASIKGQPYRHNEQKRLLKQLLNFAIHQVPFFTEFYGDHRITADKIKAIDDITCLPLLHREDMKAVPLNSLKPTGLSGPLQKASTSGSSGTPFTMYRTLNAIMFYGGQLLRYFDYWGVTGKSKVFFILYNADPTISIDLPYWSETAFLNNKHSVNPEEPIKKIATKIVKEKPELIIGHPTMMEDICRWVIDNNTFHNNRLQQTWLPKFATGGEMLTSKIRRTIEKAFPGAKLFNFYNSVETGLTAFEESSGSGMTINDYSVVLEKGPADKLQAGREATYFRPVFTVLRNYGTPLIRYTGIEDYLHTRTIHNHEGMEKTVITDILGRETDMIYGPEGKKISVCNLSSAHADLKDVRRFQYVQPNSSKLIFRYIPDDNANREEIKRTVQQYTHRILGEKLNISFEEVKKIERTGNSLKIPILVKK